MADRYLVLPAGATAAATWDAYNTAIWSDVSGGATGFSAPTINDNIFMDANSGSGTVTLSNNGPNGATGQFCHDINCVGFAGIVNMTNQTITINGSVNRLRLSAGNSATVIFNSTAAETITWGGFGMGGDPGNMIFNGIGGSWQFLDALLSGQNNQTITITNGTVDTNGFQVRCSRISSSSSNVRSLICGASIFTLSDPTLCLDFAIVTNFTFTCGTSTMNCVTYSTGGCSYNLGGLTYNIINITPQSLPTISITGGCTCATLTITGVVAKYTIPISGNITVTGTFTVNANSLVNRILIKSDIPGTARTITAAVCVLTNGVDFMDIAGAGAAAPFNGASVGDCLGNSGITPTAAVTRYAVLAGNWSAIATWSAASGGAGGATVPLPQDTVVLDGSSGVGTITCDMPRMGVSLTCTNYIGTLAFSSTNNTVYGNVIFGKGMTVSGTAQLTLAGRGAQTITSNGKVMTMIVIITAPGGGYTLQDNFAGTQIGAVANSTCAGTLTCNGFQISATLNIFSGSLTVTDNLVISGAFGITIGATSSSITTTATFLGTVTVNGTSTTGLLINYASTVLFSGTLTINTATGPGINIASTGSPVALITATFSSAVTVNTVSGAGFTHGVGAATSTSVLFSSTLDLIASGVVGIFTQTGGTVVFTGAVTISQGGGTGISLNNSTTTFGSTLSVTSTSVISTAYQLSFAGTAVVIFTGDVTISGIMPINVNAITTGVFTFLANVIITTATCLSGSVNFNIVDLQFYIPNLQLTNAAFVGTGVNLNCGSLTLAGNTSLALTSGIKIGTLTANTSTVTFTGTSSVLIGSGSFYNLTINTGTVTLASSIVIANTFTMTKGSISAGIYNITAKTFSGSNTNVRSITSNGKIYLTGTGTVWDCSIATNMIIAGKPTIIINDPTAANKVFAGGGLTYNDIWLTGAGTGEFQFSGSNIFNNFRCDTPPHTIAFTNGTTTTVRAWMVSGDSVNPITVTGLAGGDYTLALTGGGTTSSDYLDIDHMTGSPAATWYAGSHSNDNGNNHDVSFADNAAPPVATLSRGGLQFLDGSIQMRSLRN